MSSNSVRHNDDMNPFIRSYDVKSLQSVLFSVVGEENRGGVRNCSKFKELPYTYLMKHQRKTL